MCSDLAISVKNLIKTYRIFDHPTDRIKQTLTLGRIPFYREFTALQNVSFEIKKGETVGIIGRNGSGKSTLLQLICGILKPSSGTINVHGRIAALLELGAGFSPEFTGRENVYMNCAVLGLHKAEVDERFNDIAAFADIGQFIDQPVSKYSSGMYIRLAFAVAINVDPEILIVDEALSVGDELFQRKCFSRIEQIRSKGATVLFVSHSGSQVTQLCDRGILLDTGEKLLEGDPKTVVSHYQRLLYAQESERTRIRKEICEYDQTPETSTHATEAGVANGGQAEYFDPALFPANTITYIANGARIESVAVRTMNGQLVNTLRRGLRYRYTYKVTFDRGMSNARFGMLIKTKEGMELGGGVAVYGTENGKASILKGQVAEVDFSFDCRLNPGIYFTNAGVTGGEGGSDTVLHRMLDAFAFKVLPESDDMSTAIVDFGCKSSVNLAVGEK